jgi:hypothetical protein
VGQVVRSWPDARNYEATPNSKGAVIKSENRKSKFEANPNFQKAVGECPASGAASYESAGAQKYIRAQAGADVAAPEDGRSPPPLFARRL